MILRALLVSLLLVSGAEARTARYIYRQLDTSTWGESPGPDMLRTFALSVDNGVVSVDVTQAHQERDGRWTQDGHVVLLGRATVDELVITVPGGLDPQRRDDQVARYACKPMRVPVAAASAIRMPVGGGYEGAMNGIWWPDETQQLPARVCIATTFAAPLPSELVLVVPGVEKVRGDNSCCRAPTSGLRRIPADGSVAAAHAPRK